MRLHWRRRLLLVGALSAGIALVVLLATGVLVGNRGGLAPAPVTTSAAPSGVRLAGGTGEYPFSTRDWGTYGNTFGEIRHSPLTQITTANVNQLGRVFSIDFRKLDPAIPKGQQSFPIVVNGVIYVTTPNDYVFAVDGATGKVFWKFKPSGTGIFRNFGVNANRGVAYCDGKLFLLTLDMRIVAIDPRTGHELQEVQIADAVPGAHVEVGYSETQAPICYQHLVLIGAAGSDYGVRGFFMAYHGADLTPAWANPYWTIPPDGQSWRAGGRYHGGGTNWNPATVDAATGVAYITTANPSPIYQPGVRRGPDPRTDSVVAIDLRTGHQLWWQQQIAGDQWGYSTVQPVLLYTGKVGGTRRKIVSVGTKEGTWFAYDARTGASIYQRVKLLTHIEHPVLQPGKTVSIYPSSLGGLNYSPSSYDPATNYVINNQAETAVKLTQAPLGLLQKSRIPGDVDLGLLGAEHGTTPAGWHDYGSVTAVDVNTGRLVWRYVTPEPGRGGVTTTSTGLSFVGGGDGVLRAFETATGNLLWSFQTGFQIAAGPSIYETNGKEFVAITTGGTATSSFGGTATRLDVYALGGSQTQSPASPLRPPGPPPGLAAAPLSFLSLQPQPRTLGLLATASLNDSAGAPTINGYRDGRMVVRVPQGWTVDVTFGNHSAVGRDSLVVTAGGAGGPPQSLTPAFRGAASPVTAAGGVQYFRFTATTQGTYALASGVPGRAAQGEWATIQVVASGAPPELVLDGQTFAIDVTAPRG